MSVGIVLDVALGTPRGDAAQQAVHLVIDAGLAGEPRKVLVFASLRRRAAVGVAIEVEAIGELALDNLQRRIDSGRRADADVLAVLAAEVGFAQFSGDLNGK